MVNKMTNFKFPDMPGEMRLLLSCLSFAPAGAGLCGSGQKRSPPCKNGAPYYDVGHRAFCPSVLARACQEKAAHHETP